MSRLYPSLVASFMAIMLLGGRPAPAIGQSSQSAVIAPSGRIETRRYDFAEAGVQMDYELFVPSSYDPARPSPLIVALHGLGSTPRVAIRYQGLTTLAEERGYIVVAPMGYSRSGWYGSRGHGAILNRTGGDGATNPPNHGILSEQDVMNVIGIVRRDFNVDARRIFAFGHSMGGGGAYHLAMEHPRLFAALAPVAPAIYGSPDSLALIRDIPVIVIQGDADRLVDVAVTRRWVEKMRELGMRHEYVEIAGGDHSMLIARNPANMRKVFDFFDRVGTRTGNDLSTIDGIMASLYGSISGRVGQARDWTLFDSLFHADARLMPTSCRPTGECSVRILTPTGYRAAVDSFLVATGFRETEMIRRVERFGAVAHVFSSYASFRFGDDVPFARGINSVQLYWDGTRWWILSVLWDSERPSNPIPAEFGPPGRP
ncbi:MAG: alpha/beta hydrolase [Gemmatimonadales bacterium]|nr:alpha/beta hydrolase [Gemmatimonadales bacterium]